MRVVILSIAATLVSLLLLVLLPNTVDAFTTSAPPFGVTQRQQSSSSELHGVRTFIQNSLGSDKEDDDDEEATLPMTNLEPPSLEIEAKTRFSSARDIQEASICIIGGGVAGLTAAITAAEASSDDTTKIILVEASPTFGGRVQSDITDDGFILDRGFAVFIEEYPFSKQLLDYDQLALGKFLPGAMVKLKGTAELAKVADPIRQPQELFTALLAPVGSLVDKVKVLPLLYTVFTKEIDELFAEDDIPTLQALKERWGFSNDFIQTFYRPFLEGIYLAPLEEQSSRMFHFIFKMFSEGAATLPKGGMGAVSKQLEERAKKAGVELKSSFPVGALTVIEEDGSFTIDSTDGKSRIIAKSVIMATDASVAESLLAQVEPSLESTPEITQRSVGCLYYGFDGPAPVQEPILILSGLGDERGTKGKFVNNVCFPSVVCPSYAPKGKSLCSVTVLKTAMEVYKGREADLDAAVRKQLADWFPACNVQDDWELKRIYSIPNAQPAQFNGPMPANANGGRDCTTFRGTSLPAGLYVCGDHMATATLNGALESGVNAGKAATS